MGDRFYLQQLEKFGSCAGSKSTKRKRKMAWTTEKKEEAVRMYNEGTPTPENSMDLVKEIAEELEESPNGVRMILQKAGVYVKGKTKEPTETLEPKEGGRVSKDAAHGALKKAIMELGGSVDEEIISKLTGKAAQYFTSVFMKLKN